MKTADTPEPARRSCRAVFLSDLHLGARGCRPGPILAFLRMIEADRLTLVGDVFDIWHAGRIHWRDDHDAILSELGRQIRGGTRVVYLPGNHDAMMRHPDSSPPIDGCEIRDAVIHAGADDRRYLVTHGDQCDSRVMRRPAMTRLGARLDAALRRADTAVRHWRGTPAARRTPVQRIIEAANALMTLGDRFETRATALAAAAGADGLICGHSHKPALKRHNGLDYADCGDWVDNLTALVEEPNGRLRLVQWGAESAQSPARAPAAGLAEQRA